jgi:hypothetical protein
LAPVQALSSALLPQIEAAAAAFEKSAAFAAAVRVRRGRVCTPHRLQPGDDLSLLGGRFGLRDRRACGAGQHAFLNHHFPASDIPKQARALYVRNLVRVIPDVS